MSATPAATAPYLAAVLMLGIAGIAKFAQPNDTALALRTAGVRRATATAVRAGAAAEVVFAAAALAIPAPATAAFVAAAYIAFAIFVIEALRRGWVLASCGCFGKADSQPTMSHVLLNLGAAAASIWWGATVPQGSGSATPGRIFLPNPWLPFVTVVVAGLAYLVWTDPLAKARRS